MSSAAGSVSAPQGKLASKIRKKEYTTRSLQIESERIRAKGGNDELTAGQASTLARNEQVIDRLKEEVSMSTPERRCRSSRQRRLGTPSGWLRRSAEMSPGADPAIGRQARTRQR